MTFIGVMLIVYGVLIVFSLWGILICWIPIWMGVLLIQAAGRANEAVERQDAVQVSDMLGKLGTFFILNGVLLIIMLAVILIAVIAVVVLGAGMMSMMRF